MPTLIERNGIIASGNWIVDHIKTIDVYPVENALANIKTEYANNGGAPFNVLKNLSKMEVSFPLRAIGIVGNDENGRWIKDDCIKNSIDVAELKMVEGVPTSYTDVMTVESNGRRTFFHQRGANALLDKLDKIYNSGITSAAKVLRSAQSFGLKTSIDIVSENSNRFNQIVVPTLPFVNYLFFNQFETERTTGVKLSGDFPEINALRKAANMLISFGVQDWVFIHFPFGVFALSKNGEELLQGSVQFPKEKIKSTVGAGDALASGILFALHENWDMTDTLKMGATAARTLTRPKDVSLWMNKKQSKF